MKKQTDINDKSNIERICLVWCIPVLFLVFAAFLYGLTTSVTYELYQEIDLQTMLHSGRLPVVLGAVIFSLLWYGLYRRTSFFRKKYLALAVTFAVTILFSLYLIFAVHGLATNDALQLDGIANAFLHGDFSELKTVGSYLYVYPFQLGYVAWCELLAVLAGESNYTVHQLMNLIAVLVTFVFLAKLTGELFPEEADKARVTGQRFTMLFCAGALFLTVHTTFIYGDIVSLAPLSAAMFFLAKHLRTGTFKEAVIGGVLLGLSILLKTNGYIALIAAVIMMLLQTVVTRETKRLIAVVAVILLSLLPGRITDAAYRQAADVPAIPGGVPSSTYFAMAIQDNGYGQAGWYNGYNANTYRENGYDHARTDAAAKARFREDFHDLASSPYRFVRFYGKKFLTQWGDASCISLRELELTSRHVEGHSDLVNSLIYGRGRTVLYYLMQVFQLLVYGGVLLYGVQSLNILRSAGTEPVEVPHVEGAANRVPHVNITPASSLLLLYIFGGMLFHEIWEGSSRYTMRYYIFLIPFAACGFFFLFNKTGKIPGSKEPNP